VSDLLGVVLLLVVFLVVGRSQCGTMMTTAVWVITLRNTIGFFIGLANSLVEGGSRADAGMRVDGRGLADGSFQQAKTESALLTTIGLVDSIRWSKAEGKWTGPLRELELARRCFRSGPVRVGLSVDQLRQVFLAGDAAAAVGRGVLVASRVTLSLGTSRTISTKNF
jgi:hypothetical protein